LKKSADKPSFFTSVKNTLSLKNHSLSTIVWIYFTLFSLAIMLLMWAIQFFFLESYYRAAKIKSAEEICVEVEKEISNPNVSDYISSLAFKNGVCIVVTDVSGNVYSVENNLGRFSFLYDDVYNKYGESMYRLRTKLADDDQFATEIYRNLQLKSDELICAMLIDGDSGQSFVVYVETTIEPVTATTAMFNKQLFFITIILVEISFIMAMIFSRRISNPISQITKTAKKFGQGDMDVVFKGADYKEASDLANTLNNAKDEISKVTNLRKDLIANVSHDLKTPLTMIKAYAEMIRDLSGDNPKKRAEHIDVIIEESDRLTALVNNLLELSKLESGNAELNVSEFSVHSFLDDIMKRYTLLVERDGYNIEFIKSEDRLIKADYDKMSQVLYNFVNNAVNYSGDSKDIQVRQINKGSNVRIEIVDHGVGISKDMLPVIFDRYYRGNKTQREVVGSGIGLSIVKGILKSHGLPFGVMSEEGKGSIFWFEFSGARNLDKSEIISGEIKKKRSKHSKNR